MIIKQQKVRAMKDNHVSFLSFSPTFSSNSGLTYQSFENNQVAGGRRGCRRAVVKQGAVLLLLLLDGNNDGKFGFKKDRLKECRACDQDRTKKWLRPFDSYLL